MNSADGDAIEMSGWITYCKRYRRCAGWTRYALSPIDGDIL